MSDTKQSICWTLETRGLGNRPTGFFFLGWQCPDDVTVKDIADRAGLDNSTLALFLKTEPLWYGLWADSPLSPQQVVVIQALLREIAGRPAWSRTSEVAEFLAALDRAIQENLPMHVQMLPPGHVDFGIHNTFAHCPRCKAIAHYQVWREQPSSELQPCRVCGMHYVPSETQSREILYYTKSVVCISCNEQTPMDQFTDSEKEILELHHLYHYFCAELRVLKCVEELSERDPRVHEIHEDNTVQFRKRSKAIDQLLAKLSDTPESEWSPRDRGTLKYLKSNSFQTSARLHFVNERIAQLKPKVDADFVFCPHCHGAIH